MSASTHMIRPLAWCCAAIVLATSGLLLAVAKPKTPAPRGDSASSVGGLEYRAVLGRRIDPANPVDARIVKGLPIGDRKLPRGRVLYGAFVSVANGSHRTLPSAARIDLRDDSLHVYRPLRLPQANRFAYRPGRLAPGTELPRHGTPAADDLAAGGRLLLYRVPAWEYRNSRFELVVHLPGHAAATRSVVL